MKLPAKSSVKLSLQPKAKVSMPKASLASAKARGMKPTRDYRKQALKDAAEFGNVGFGNTGLTGQD